MTTMTVVNDGDNDENDAAIAACGMNGSGISEADG